MPGVSITPYVSVIAVELDIQDLDRSLNHPDTPQPLVV
jgi:hypothetical protein